MDGAQAKFLAETFAGSLEREFNTTCKVLAAVRDDNKGYKPDEKSRTAWDLATHIATSDVWFLDGIVNGKFAQGGDTPTFNSVNEVVEFYKKAYPAKIAEIRAMTPEQLTRIVDFFGVMKVPAAALLPIANNHGIHHRGQLAAYLRPMGSKVPAIYGGSADEPMNM